MLHQFPRIAVTMGDPAGVGPEICLRLLANPEIAAQCRVLVFGDAAVLEAVAQRCELPLDAPVVHWDQWGMSRDAITQPTIIDFGCIDLEKLEPGHVSAACGAASYSYVE